MRLQKHFAKKLGNKSYYKYVVVIPPELVEKANFKEGQELGAEAREGEIRLRGK
jgi:antitoxin component of MazEF toxin-antitoxin module